MMITKCQEHTSNTDVNLVWFKRDLRCEDHQALFEAAKTGVVLPVYIVEDSYWKLESVSERHRSFAAESVQSLSKRIDTLGGRLLIMSGDVIEVFVYLQKRFNFKRIFSHQETGNNWTYGRDLGVKLWCKNAGVFWNEYQSNGVIRCLKSRDGWSGLWNKTMQSTVSKVPKICFANLTDLSSVKFVGASKSSIQKGGRENVMNVLNSFLNERGRKYRGGISSPVTAIQACSRLSPYLALGSISIREVYQSLQLRVGQLKEQSPLQRKGWLGSLKDFQSRLYWHCHFIQKLELMPYMEFKNVHSAYDGLREDSFNDRFYQSWLEGRTGFPFIDASMRYLNKFGWINFRMRAMLVSFATNNLWLHWRPVAKHLGKMFTDFEPGIHYSQVQMQAGTTGINAPRIYNPVKQSRDQDPDGSFIRKNVPELGNVTEEFIHTPWEMEESNFKKLNYPKPIVDHIASSKTARQRLFSVRKKSGFKEEAQYILKQLASRKKS